MTPAPSAEASPGKPARRAQRTRHARLRPHLLGIDDGPFEKRRGRVAPVVGVMMEACDVVEAVVRTEFPVDGEGATEFLRDWVASLRLRPALQGIVLGGITIAGLAVVDAGRLAEELALPVMVVNRRAPHDARLAGALRAAGFEHRIELVRRAPPPFALEERLFVSAAGVDRSRATRLLRASLGKSDLPEPLRVAHLIARAIASGESRGRP